MASSLPTLSYQEPNIILRTHLPLDSYVETIDLPTDYHEGGWVQYGSSGWAMVVGNESEDIGNNTYKWGPIWPIIGKPGESSRQVMKSSITNAAGKLPIYMGPLPIILDTKYYDADTGLSVAFAAGLPVFAKQATISAVKYTLATTADSASWLLGKILLAPADNNGFLRIMLNPGAPVLVA